VYSGAAELCGAIEVGDMLHSVNGHHVTAGTHSTSFTGTKVQILTQVTAEGIEELRKLIGGPEGSKLEIVFLTDEAHVGDFFLDVKQMSQTHWRAVELVRDRPFAAYSQLLGRYPVYLI